MKKSVIFLSSTRTKKSILLFLSLICLLGVNGQKRKAGSGRYIPQFSYEPQTRSKPASTGITIAEITPFFAGRNDESFATPLKNFKSSMESELEVLLMAKGYKVRGPFQTRDEMVFEDKRQSDFTLQIAIKWDATFIRNIKPIRGPGGYKNKKGELSISSSLDITAISNFSGEKLWKKHLSLDPQNFTWTGSIDFGDEQNVPFWTEYDKDNNLAEPLGKALEETYKKCMEYLWHQFEVNEVIGIVEQAKAERSSERKVKEN